MSEHDPRWQWIEAPRKIGSRDVEWVRGPCNHLAEHVVPVESGGVVVANLCLTCDQQLDSGYASTHVTPIAHL